MSVASEKNTACNYFSADQEKPEDAPMGAEEAE